MSTNKKAVKRTNSERFTAIFWSRIRDSNPPPTAWEAVALPDELTLQVLHYCNKAGQECQGFSARNLRSAHFGPCQIQHREKRVEYQVAHVVCQQQTLLLCHQGHYGAAFQQLLESCTVVPLMAQQKRLLLANDVRDLVFDPFFPVLDLTWAKMS